MALRLNLALGAMAVFGLVAVCSVSAARIDYAAGSVQPVAARAPTAQVASLPEDPVTTGSVGPVQAPPARIVRQESARPEPKRSEARKPDPKPDNGLDSERLAALLSGAPIGTVKPVRR